jgi:hypothetical protein
VISVLLPESFRGGCSFGAECNASGTTDSSDTKLAQGRLIQGFHLRKPSLEDSTDKPY